MNGLESVDEDDLKNVYAHKETPQEQKLKKKSLVAKMNAVTGDQARLGKYVAIDCEMVGVGPEGTDSALAHYRTHVSGIEAKHLESEEALSFKDAQFKAEAIIRGRILVGHAVYNDLQALMISHPALLIRDTSRYKPFRKLAKGRTPGLKMLVNEVLGISIQSGSHSSVEDARFTMQLYKSVKLEWEKSFGAKISAKEEQNSSKKKVSIKEVAEDSESNSQSDSNSDSDSEDDASDDEE
ncbi:ribonuclease H-like domain-containing protein [Mucor mucedo]|uniref:ribonuclease H-like domain-containing protein n=1 Tax=Mucor mucedo TaxID=29922 RepID=UPI00221FC510|nr:ribonuclease H-like domain-containing protein [Mucor mucedo]XP_051459871.1 ribonuclease H-like domain-containing protein [Mucor mucedo]KAI7867887.1 ribonuclease H-like domain-containing protein [Mucor mucedo]KAI7893455.1 ribonuclease H-like domain-containing protein [Mucor mucedo]